MIGLLALVILFAPIVLGTGHFLSPSGSDGTTTVKEGDQISISWTGVNDYDLFSLGYYSTSNATITWLISNSPDHPTQYTWSVDAVEQGFDLQSSHMFRFYACKDYNFSQPFQSTLFSIADVSSASSTTSSASSKTKTAHSSTSTSSGTTSVASSTTATTTTTSTATSVSSNSHVVSSTGLSSGAKIGIGVGVGGGVIAAAVMVFFAIRHMRKSSQAHKSGGYHQEYKASMYGDQSAHFGAYGQMQQQQSSGAYKGFNLASPYVQEAPGSTNESHRAVEMPATGTPMSENRSELPNPR